MRSSVNLYVLWRELPFRMQRHEISKSKSPDCALVRAEFKELVAHSENQLMHRVAQVARLRETEEELKCPKEMDTW